MEFLSSLRIDSQVVYRAIFKTPNAIMFTEKDAKPN